MLSPGERAISREQSSVILERLDKVEGQLRHLRDGVRPPAAGASDRCIAVMVDGLDDDDLRTALIASLERSDAG